MKVKVMTKYNDDNKLPVLITHAKKMIQIKQHFQNTLYVEWESPMKE